MKADLMIFESISWIKEWTTSFGATTATKRLPQSPPPPHFFFVEHRFTEGVTWHVVDKSHQDSSPLGAGVTVILSPVLKRCWKRFSRKGCATFTRGKNGLEQNSRIFSFFFCEKDTRHDWLNYGRGLLGISRTRAKIFIARSTRGNKRTLKTPALS